MTSLLGPARAGLQDLREVRRGVAQAGDEQMLQVVRMVDSLAHRGETDAVLAPVRRRLRFIQPERPLRFARLLFLPVDPLILSPSAWRPGGCFVPRQSLELLAEAVRARMVAQPATRAVLEAVDAAIASATTAQADVVRLAGGGLWPAAAEALLWVSGLRADAPGLGCFAAWVKLGLPAEELPQLAACLSGVLAAAPWLYDALCGGAAPAERLLLERLADTERLGRRAWGMMLSLLMLRVPSACGALLAAAAAKPAFRPMTDMAADAALGWVEAETAAQPGGVTEDAAAEVNRQVSLLDHLGELPADAARKRRLLGARAALVESSLGRFQASLKESVTGALAALPEAGEARGSALDALEAGARLLRCFELEARRLGGGAQFDAVVAAAERQLRTWPGLTTMDRARLVELLAGPEAAVKLLNG